MARPTTQKNIGEPETPNGNSCQVVHPAEGAIADSAAQAARRTRQYGPPDHGPTEYARHQNQGLPERGLPADAELARTAKKERTVVGFVAFSRNAEIKSELADEPASSALGDRSGFR